MHLNELSNNIGAKKKKKRVGRGDKTCGRGVKGQKSRSGVAIKGFEGGQTPIIKRLPKRGFNNISTIKYDVINIYNIQALLLEGILSIDEVITKEKLIEIGLIKGNKSLVKLLSATDDSLNVPLKLRLDAYSLKAKEVVEKAGGQIII